jgi:hypothetical protein
MMTGPEGTKWSGLETPGMKEAKCSLLLQEDVSYDAKIKALPKQRVLVYQDKSFHSNDNTTSNNNGQQQQQNSEDNFYVDFKGATILQLEPALKANHKTMPVTLTVGGRCLFTPENYQDFRVMMRTKQQSLEMEIASNGNFDWPDVESLLLCPVCGEKAPIPFGDRNEQEYWMVFYPLLQITVMKGSQMTLGTRTICRLACLECIEDMLEGMTLTVRPGAAKSASGQMRTLLAFTLPALDVLAEAGSASFLEDGPPRPDTHPHVDDILDGWTLYNLWEHSGAWEALQNDYRIVLSKSMHADSNNNSTANNNNDPTTADELQEEIIEPRLKERMGKSCGNAACNKVHGRPDDASGEIVRLGIKCRDCHSEFYCGKACRETAKDAHQPDCERKQREREERREKKTKKVECNTCHKKFPYTKMKKCSRCRNATYCSVECQKSDWESHKLTCQNNKEPGEER